MAAKQLRMLPRRIAVNMFLGCFVFAATLVASIYWMTVALNEQASRTGRLQMSSVQSSWLSRANTLVLDYANWDAAVEAVRSDDEAWIYENIGSTASIGQTLQFVEIWGGPTQHAMAWLAGDAEQPRASLLDRDTKAVVERVLGAGETSERNAAKFFAWHGGRLYAFAAAPFRPLTPSMRSEDGTGDGFLVMGLELSEPLLQDVSNTFQIQGVRLDRTLASSGSHVELLGITGEPVAYLTWNAIEPGTNLLRQMIPYLMLVASLAVMLAIRGQLTAKRSADYLVLAEFSASLAARTCAQTGLPNRLALAEAMQSHAKAFRRAVLFLDVNGFKRINDSLGHAAGDEVILAVAQRLKTMADDDVLVAHVAGDEFAALIDGPHASERIAICAAKIHDSFDAPFKVLEREIYLRAAIGYAVQPHDAFSSDELLRNADLAMYQSKKDWRQGPVLFCDALETTVRDDLALEQALQRTISDPEDLVVEYQPIVRTNGSFARAEALARWAPAGFGPIAPNRFIRLAEQAGLMAPLGEVILKKVLDDLRQEPSLAVNVNISSSQLIENKFVDRLVSLADEYQVDASRIQLEVTESVLISDFSMMKTCFMQLRSAGFGVAIDDFGTGYSSIAYLDHLGFDTLKLDRSFASGLRHSDRRLALIRSIVRMAHDLGLQVVCEGVEKLEDLELLRGLNCDFVQGFYFDKSLPMPALISRWLHRLGPDLAA